MTNKEIEMFLANEKLIYFTVNRIIYDKSKRQDMYSVGKIGLIKAVKSFDEKRGVSFSAYATLCIKNEVFMAIRNEKRHNVETVEYNDETTGNIDYLFDNERWWLDISGILNAKEYSCLELLAQGYNQNEISNITGIARTYVCRLLQSARNKLKQGGYKK